MYRVTLKFYCLKMRDHLNQMEKSKFYVFDHSKTDGVHLVNFMVSIINLK
jgi:hypothetical protein